MNTKLRARDTSVNVCVCFLQEEMSSSCCFSLVLLTEHYGKRQHSRAGQMGTEMDQIVHLCCINCAVPLGHISVCVCVYDNFLTMEIFYLLNQL